MKKADNSKEDMKRARWEVKRGEKTTEKTVKTVNNHRQQWSFDGLSHWMCTFLWKYMKLHSSAPGKFERHHYKVILLNKMKLWANFTILLSLFELLVQQNPQIRFLIDALPVYFISSFQWSQRMMVCTNLPPLKAEDWVTLSKEVYNNCREPLACPVISMAVTRLHIDQCLTRLQIRRLGLKEHPQSSTESYCHTAQSRATLTAITAEGLCKQVFISVPHPDAGIFLHSAHGSSWTRTSDCEQKQAIPQTDRPTVWALCFTLTEKHLLIMFLSPACWTVEIMF